jgi:hypothetical protein
LPDMSVARRLCAAVCTESESMPPMGTCM